ncbi:MAG TPA: hypothetical protein PK509_08630 [Catalimonadaceae bacterium]|jgi:hypothetical protein|nr:hypothetical protein [Catalimonadaceae bacterium]HPI10312.1 hypothetical protein [Catalimonadaceae bacterium]
MKTFVNSHFLSAKDNLRFVLFVASAFLLLVLGAANKEKPLQLLPSQNQIMDTKPNQSGMPKIHKPMAEKSDFKKV